jgi:hypothetical protein
VFLDLKNTLINRVKLSCKLISRALHGLKGRKVDLVAVCAPFGDSVLRLASLVSQEAVFAVAVVGFAHHVSRHKWLLVVKKTQR